jgi:hypothetical protein
VTSVRHCLKSSIRHAVAVELPGFGVPQLNGFAGTKDTYADWLADTLRHVDGSVVLAGTAISGYTANRRGLPPARWPLLRVAPYTSRGHLDRDRASEAVTSLSDAQRRVQLQTITPEILAGSANCGLRAEARRLPKPRIGGSSPSGATFQLECGLRLWTWCPIRVATAILQQRFAIWRPFVHRPRALPVWPPPRGWASTAPPSRRGSRPARLPQAPSHQRTKEWWDPHGPPPRPSAV